MYRANDPRFRRRLNEIGQTLENANESAQSSIYIFAQTYIKPCFEGISSGVTSCIDASCPSLNISQRDRLRRQRGRGRVPAELSFDFYDDWEDEENEGLLGWGSADDFDVLAASNAGYGTVAQTQPSRQQGSMSYPRGRRRSTLGVHGSEADATEIARGPGFFRRLFGGRALTYRPSAAGLQDNPGSRAQGKTWTEGEALLGDSQRASRAHGRQRSETGSSGRTSDSFSSRGDIFPSDGEDDAVPLDDEFAMVLERRITPSAAGPDTSNSSSKTREADRRRGKRPSTGSRSSTGRGTNSSRGRKSTSSTIHTPVEQSASLFDGERALSPPSMVELKQDEHGVDQLEETNVQGKGEDAERLLAGERVSVVGDEPQASSQEAAARATSPIITSREPSNSTESDIAGRAEPSTTTTTTITADEGATTADG